MCRPGLEVIGTSNALNKENLKPDVVLYLKEFTDKIKEKAQNTMTRQVHVEMKYKACDDIPSAPENQSNNIMINPINSGTLNNWDLCRSVDSESTRKCDRTVSSIDDALQCRLMFLICVSGHMAVYLAAVTTRRGKCARASR